MSKEENNKAIVGRWFTDFWGKTCNLGIVDELAAPDMLLQYSLHAPRKGHADIKAFMADFRKAFPDLNFWGAADLIAEGDYVVGRWEGGGTHTGPAFSDFLVGSLPAATGRKMRFHRNDRAEAQRRQDRRRDRSGRRRDRAAAARTAQSRLITRTRVYTHDQLINRRNALRKDCWPREGWQSSLSLARLRGFPDYSRLAWQRRFRTVRKTPPR